MNVATRLLLQQMESDIKELKQSVAALEQRVNELEAESREMFVDSTSLSELTRPVAPGRTLSLPEKKRA